MKTLFVTPKEYSSRQGINRFLLRQSASSSFSLLAALNPYNHQIDIVDEVFGSIDYEKKYDLVGITSVTKTITRAYRIADNSRDKKITVIIGGYHASALPKEAKQHADCVVIGEAEEVWPEIINDFEKKQLKPFYFQIRPVDPNLIPFPKKDVYPKNTAFQIQTTRGCKYNCIFCSMGNQIHRKKFKMRPIDSFIEEIKQYAGKGFVFRVNSFTLDTNYSKKILKKIKPLNKKFFAFGNINVLGNDEELLNLASEAGCFSWFVGFESIMQKILDKIHKKSNKIKHYIASVKKIHDYGMTVLGQFIFGFDNDTKTTFHNTSEFVNQSEIDSPEFNILTPYPGTPIYEILNKQGRILHNDWDKYDLEHVVFQPTT